MPIAATPGAVTPLAICVMAFALWIVGTNSGANPSYTAVAPYHAAFLAGGFLVGRRAGAENAGSAFRVALVFALALAGWALWQQMAQGEARAHGPFVTPATLASTINLVLVPGLVLAALGTRRPVLVAALVVLSAALAAAQSRGGWLALAAVGVVALLFVRRTKVRAGGKAAAIVIAILALGWIGYWLARLAWDWGAPQHSMLDEAAQSSAARLQLYELAVQGIASSPWLLGSGYHAFYYILESARPTVPAYLASTTYFVHNDYLQTLLELGVPGLAGLLLIIVLPISEAWRAAPRLAETADERVALIAIVGAICSMAVHALADFPFYIPVCVLVYGTALGILDASLLRTACVRPVQLPKFANPTARGVAVAAIGTLALWTLTLPVAAEAASAYAQRQWRAAKGESAAVWFEAARRLDPRDWRYHWYAGQFWLAQAQGSGNAAAANLADASFAAGYSANPREVRNLFGRIIVHQRLRKLLPAPADPATLRAWADRAVALAPLDPAVRAERARVLKDFGGAK